MEGFVWFDLILAALVLILGIKGLMNGFIKEVFGIIGLIGGVIVASRYATEVGELVSKNVYAVQETFWFHLGFLVTLIVFWLLCLGLGYIFSKMLSMSGFSFVDRLLGFIVGSAKIFLVFAIFVFIISNIKIINEKLEPYTKNSFFYPILLQSGEFIMNQSVKTELTGNMPDVNASINKAKEQMSEQLENKIQDATSAVLGENNDANKTAF